MRVIVQHGRSREVYGCESIECMCTVRIRGHRRMESTRMESRKSRRQGRREREQMVILPPTTCSEDSKLQLPERPAKDTVGAHTGVLVPGCV